MIPSIALLVHRCGAFCYEEHIFTLARQPNPWVCGTRLLKYADLNVSNPAGAAVLYQQRIRVAAAQVCGTPDQRDLSRLAPAKTCTDKAIANAVSAVGNDMLTDLYQAKTHYLAAVQFASN